MAPTGQYKYCVMSYRLVNTPSIFQGFMNEIFWYYLHHFVLIYIDDILMYSWNHHFSKVLKKLSVYQLFLKVEKFTFYHSSIQFLGYHISAEWIKMDEGKVRTVRTWSAPTSVK